MPPAYDNTRIPRGAYAVQYMVQSWGYCLKERKVESLLGQGAPVRSGAAEQLCLCGAAKADPLAVANAGLVLMVQQHLLHVWGVRGAHTDVWSCRISVGLRSQCCFLSSCAHSAPHTSTHICTLWSQVHPFLLRTSRLYTALYSCPPITEGDSGRSFLGFPPPSSAPSVPFSDPIGMAQVRTPNPLEPLKECTHT